MNPTRAALPRLAASVAPTSGAPALAASNAAAGLASFSSSSTTSTASSIPQPNRMTAAFNEMKRSCPDEMAAYADCVVRGHKDGNLERGACQAEFDLVKKCFRTARRGGAAK